MMIDTHAHFSDAQFDQDRQQCLERAKRCGVETVLEIADGPESWNAARALAQPAPELPQIFWACGFHPHYAEQVHAFNFDLMLKAATDPRCLAIGEVGLDYAKSTADKADQFMLLRKTLEVAAALQKPVIIHCRDAQADTLRILKSFYAGSARADVATGVIHCFSGDIHFAQAVLELGFLLGVDGPLTYPSANALRETLAQVPLDRLVLETDCPYLPPQGYRGKRNESSYLPLIAEKLAQVKEVSVEQLCQVTTQNAQRLFRRKF